jgi:hypothetical protein
MSARQPSKEQDPARWQGRAGSVSKCRSKADGSRNSLRSDLGIRAKSGQIGNASHFLSVLQSYDSPFGQTVVILCDLQDHRSGNWVLFLFGKLARFSGTLTPMLRVVAQRDRQDIPAAQKCACRYCSSKGATLKFKRGQWGWKGGSTKQAITDFYNLVTNQIRTLIPTN